VCMRIFFQIIFKRLFPIRHHFETFATFLVVVVEADVTTIDLKVKIVLNLHLRPR